MKSIKRWKRLTAAAIALAVPMLGAGAAGAASTTVPGDSGQQGRVTDADGNGYTDAGVWVNGAYKSFYAEDGNGDYYWDLGDGRIYKTVDSPDDLDQATLTTCDYVNTYRADFGNDAFMDEGWIINDITCNGPEGASHYTYLIVSQTDPRYTGNPDWAVWGTWEYHALTESGVGNLVRPEHAA